MRKSILNSLSFRLGAAFLLASVVGVALVAFLAYRSSADSLTTFISNMQGCFQGGMMVERLLAQAKLDYAQRLTDYLWLAGATGVVVALFLGLLLARQIVRPVTEVARAAHQVAGGDLTQQVRPRGAGELHDLAQSFNHMAGELRRDRELRRSMVADIAHELRTPLSVLQGNLEGLQDGVVPPSKETFDLLHAETLALAGLVEDLRTLSLAEAGQLRFACEATDLAELAQRLTSEFKAPAALRQVHLAVEAPAGLAPVQADPARTAQVVRNLLDNALRYSPAGGSITLRLVPTADGLTLAVTDQGPGIAPEELKLVFERFYRVDRSRARATGGSGLGLAIARQLTEAQGGRIWAESTVGRGSTFSMHLPYAKG